ncbi:MAG: STAS domain-containing protein [Bacilli bacterium]|nr:STAS domain-containing protein [Bacilli bacterium]
MKVTQTKKDNATVVMVEGRLETGTAPELEMELNKIVPTCQNLVLDFSKLEYVSSAGLRVLLTAQKTMNARGGSMKITNINEVVREVFNITGFTSILTIE